MRIVLPSGVEPASSGTPSGAVLAGRSDPLLLSGIIAAALLVLGDRLLADPDTQWHVAVGRDIWRLGAVPWTDTYSHTFAGAPWIAKEWLAQLIMAAADAVAGWRGVVLLTVGTLALLFGLLFGFLRERLRSTVALAFFLLALLFLAPHFLARPLVLAHLCLFGWTLGLVRAREDGRAPSPALLVLLALWANLHGSFTSAYPLAGALGLEALLAAPAGQRLAVALRWAAFGCGALLAGCATPYGVHAMGVTATIFGSGESLPFIDEWQPLGFDTIGIVAAASAAALLAGLAAGGWRNAVRICILLGLSAACVRHVRFLDVYAIVAPLLAAGPLARRFAFLRPEAVPDASARPDRRRAIALGLLGGAIAALAVVRAPVPDPVVTPERAFAAAREAGVSGPVYNAYDFGGFLIREGVPTFIDGRTDQLFLGGFISGLYRAVKADEDGPFLALLDREGVTWALVQPSSPEARHLGRTPAWSRLYQDSSATVFVRRKVGG